MGNKIPLEFGRNYRERFMYLVTFAVFSLIMAICVPILVLNIMGADPAYYEKYKIFYQICAIAAAFIIAQVFIKSHMKVVRRRFM